MLTEPTENEPNDPRSFDRSIGAVHWQQLPEHLIWFNRNWNVCGYSCWWFIASNSIIYIRFSWNGVKSFIEKHQLLYVTPSCASEHVVSYTQMNHTKRKSQKNDLSLKAITPTTTTTTAATAAYLTWWLYFVLLLHLLLLLFLRCDFYFVIFFNSILLSSLSHSIDRLFFPALNDFDCKLWLSQRLTLCLRLFILLFSRLYCECNADYA